MAQSRSLCLGYMTISSDGPRQRLLTYFLVIVYLFSVPGREGAAGEEGLGGPFAEVDGESDAVTVVAGEDHHLFAARMAAEDGAHIFGEENRAAPAVSDAHRSKGRVQTA